MSTAADAADAPRLRLFAEDVRRVPMLGIALGIAVTALVLGWIERGLFSSLVVAACWIAVVAVVLTVLPIANSLTLTPEGFRIRSFGVFTRFVPWTQVAAIEAGQGWSGATVMVELAPEADRGIILGLPRDPALGRRTLVDSYGYEAEALAALMESRRRAAVAG